MATRRRRFINRWLTWICLGIFLAAFWILFGEPEQPTADPDYYGDRPVEEVCLGVLYFEADGVEESEAVEVSDRLRGYLRRTRRVHVPMKNEVDYAIREAGESADTRDIARILQADVLLTGTLSRSGRRYQLDARFTDSWSGRALGTQNTSQLLTAGIAPPLFGGLIGVAGYAAAFAGCAVFPLIAIPLVPVEADPVIDVRAGS